MRPHGELGAFPGRDCVRLPAASATEPLPPVPAFDAPFAANSLAAKARATHDFANDVHLWQWLADRFGAACHRAGVCKRQEGARGRFKREAEP